MASAAGGTLSQGTCTGRYGAFMPLRASAAEKWKRVDLAFHRGVDLPPVILYRLGDEYFVLDGNHRVSVARYHGLPAVEAEVTEFRTGHVAEARAA